MVAHRHEEERNRKKSDDVTRSGAKTSDVEASSRSAISRNLQLSEGSQLGHSDPRSIDGAGTDVATPDFSSVDRGTRSALASAAGGDASIMFKEDADLPSGGDTSSLQSMKGSGPMPAPIKSHMESAFSTDFSSVTVHPNSSEASSRSVQGFARGNEVHLSSQATKDGTGTLAHELAHTVQKKNAEPSNWNPESYKSAEVEADNAAKAVASGGKASVSLGAPSSAVQGDPIPGTDPDVDDGTETDPDPGPSKDPTKDENKSTEEGDETGDGTQTSKKKDPTTSTVKVGQEQTGDADDPGDGTGGNPEDTTPPPADGGDASAPPDESSDPSEKDDGKVKGVKDGKDGANEGGGAPEPVIKGGGGKGGPNSGKKGAAAKDEGDAGGGDSPAPAPDPVAQLASMESASEGADSAMSSHIDGNVSDATIDGISQSGTVVEQLGKSTDGFHKKIEKPPAKSWTDAINPMANLEKAKAQWDADPFKGSTDGLGKVLSAMHKVNTVIGTVNGILGKVSLLATGLGLVFSILVPPVGAFLLSASRIVNGVQLILSAIQLVVSLVKSGLTAVRIAKEKDPLKRQMMAQSMRADIQTGIGAGLDIILAKIGGGKKKATGGASRGYEAFKKSIKRGKGYKHGLNAAYLASTKGGFKKMLGRGWTSLKTSLKKPFTAGTIGRARAGWTSAGQSGKGFLGKTRQALSQGGDSFKGSMKKAWGNSRVMQGYNKIKAGNQGVSTSWNQTRKNALSNGKSQAGAYWEAQKEYFGKNMYGKSMGDIYNASRADGKGRFASGMGVVDDFRKNSHLTHDIYRNLNAPGSRKMGEDGTYKYASGPHAGNVKKSDWKSADPLWGLSPDAKPTNKEDPNSLLYTEQKMRRYGQTGLAVGMAADDIANADGDLAFLKALGSGYGRVKSAHQGYGSGVDGLHANNNEGDIRFASQGTLASTSRRFKDAGDGTFNRNLKGRTSLEWRDQRLQIDSQNREDAFEASRSALEGQAPGEGSPAPSEVHAIVDGIVDQLSVKMGGPGGDAGGGGGPEPVVVQPPGDRDVPINPEGLGQLAGQRATLQAMLPRIDADMADAKARKQEALIGWTKATVGKQKAAEMKGWFAKHKGATDKDVASYMTGKAKVGEMSDATQKSQSEVSKGKATVDAKQAEGQALSIKADPGAKNKEEKAEAKRKKDAWDKEYADAGYLKKGKMKLQSWASSIAGFIKKAAAWVWKKMIKPVIDFAKKQVGRFMNYLTSIIMKVMLQAAGMDSQEAHNLAFGQELDEKDETNKDAGKKLNENSQLSVEIGENASKAEKTCGEEVNRQSKNIQEGADLKAQITAHEQALAGMEEGTKAQLDGWKGRYRPYFVKEAEDQKMLGGAGADPSAASTPGPKVGAGDVMGVITAAKIVESDSKQAQDSVQTYGSTAISQATAGVDTDSAADTKAAETWATNQVSQAKEDDPESKTEVAETEKERKKDITGLNKRRKGAITTNVQSVTTEHKSAEETRRNSMAAAASEAKSLLAKPLDDAVSKALGRIANKIKGEADQVSKDKAGAVTDINDALNEAYQ